MMVDDLPRRASSLKAEAERLERHRIFNEILQDRHRFAHFLRFVDRNSQPNPQQPDGMYVCAVYHVILSSVCAYDTPHVVCHI